MLFLKKFKAVGFKSFANPIELSFKDSMIGVVGPNGSGKSNIVDAIKWVLGEQSKKALRGKSSSDIIFHGSKDKDGSDFALVSLTFDNSNKILHSDLEEVTVTRKLTRNEGANDYFINNEPCRLKDIQELFLDTGLTKGSLGIISQGTVQWFVEAKPEERRKIFEDAAGIGLYAKKKEESVSELEKATVNLNRVSDYVNILEKDIKKLSKQVEKAKIYQEKKKQLMELELIILVKDISFYQAKLGELKAIIDRNRQIVTSNEADIETVSQQLVSVKEKANRSDAEVEEFNVRFTNIIQEINKLDIKKSAIESNLQNDLSSGSAKTKAKALGQLISNLKYDLKTAKENKQKLEDEIQGYEEIKNDQQIKSDNASAKVASLINKISELGYKLRSVEDRIDNEYVNDAGTKTVMENQQALHGIVGTVKDFITVDKQYETAITLALGRSANFVITETEDDAKYAIDFLKSNKAGKATFLPLTLVKPRPLREEHALVVKQLDGYIDTADKLISYDVKYTDLFSMLLGRILISQDLNAAITISKYTQSAYQVVTLDGQNISVGGAITGGYSKAKFAPVFNLQENKEQLQKEIADLTKQSSQARIEQAQFASGLEETNNKLNEKKILFTTYEEKIKNIEANLFRYQTDFDQLDKSSKDESKVETVDEITKQLAELQAKKDKIVQDLNVAKATKLTNRQIADDYQARLDETRALVNKANAEQARAEVDLEKAKAVIENAKSRISSEYRMTVENAVENYNKELPMSDAQARETIQTLRFEIDQIGAINMEALKELEEKQKEFDTLSVQHKELINAKETIEKAIAELDNKARNSFRETIEKVNGELPKVFGYLFGGGTASVQYTDPNDILNSGIEVTAVPPGKKITTLNLLSGGEKSLVALSVLFAILRVHNFPLVVLDEAESALDPANVERFGNIIKNNSKETQFLVITHRPGTMERCDSLFGATMQIKGITNMYKVTLAKAKADFGSDGQ
ncbi:MAG: AAA family ATPase [Mycoplasmoidaceae bacterium]